MKAMFLQIQAHRLSIEIDPQLHPVLGLFSREVSTCNRRRIC
jgi:hypothetical protein